jgi:hypothetical protein
MANTYLLSPGVLARENDQSFITERPIAVGAAIIGPTVKGPVELPTIVRSYSDYQNRFGTTFLSGSNTYTYLTSITAYNYFQNGGDTLLVARVVTGSYTEATSSNITNNIVGAAGAFASASYEVSSSYTASQAGASTGGVIKINIPAAGGTYTDYWIVAAGTNAFNNAFNLAYVSMSAAPTLAEYGNRISTFFESASWGGNTNELNPLFSASYAGGILTIKSRTSGSALNGTIIRTGYTTGNAVYAGAPDSFFVSSSTMGGGNDGTSNGAFTLETISEGVIMNNTGTPDSAGSLASGSADNVRWEIVGPDTSSGTFTLLVRRGDDTTNNKIVLESWTNVSLDPQSSNYVSKVIGDYKPTYNPNTNQVEITGNYPNASRYVRVTAVNSPTPNYLDNNGVFKSQYTSSIPVAASGTFGGAVGDIGAGALFYNNISNIDTQGLTAGCYDNMINLLSNVDDYKFNVILTPGLIDDFGTHTSKINSIISNTQNRGDSIYVVDLVGYGSSVSTVSGKAQSKNTSYAASYWPWVQVVDPDLGKNVWVPASTVIGGVYAFNDRVAEPWFAPAGINRGGLGTVIRAERKLTSSDRDTLYQNKVNPIATFPNTGVVVYGQKTLQTKPSALDRVNVRRLLISLKSYISQVALNLVFEQNTVATRNNFLAQVNPYLESVQQRQGLYAFRVIMNESNNTADVIDRNELVGAIYLQPTKTAEFIYLDFNITPTGATFPS